MSQRSSPIPRGNTKESFEAYGWYVVLQLTRAVTTGLENSWNPRIFGGMIICAFTMHEVPVWDVSPDATHLARHSFSSAEYSGRI